MAELTISADDIQGAIEEYVSSFTSDTAKEEVGTVVDTEMASRTLRACRR